MGACAVFSRFRSQQTNMRLHLPGIKNLESRVINIHTARQRVSLPESGSWETWKKMV